MPFSSAALHHACQQGLDETLQNIGREISEPSVTVRPKMYYTASTMKPSNGKVPYGRLKLRLGHERPRVVGAHSRAILTCCRPEPERAMLPRRKCSTCDSAASPAAEGSKLCLRLSRLASAACQSILRT